MAAESCNQPAPPQFTSLNLGIPAAALQSPVKDPLPDITDLHVGITFKIDPQLLNQIGHQRLQPGQDSNSERFAKSLGIDDSTYQRIKAFFNAEGLVIKLQQTWVIQNYSHRCSREQRAEGDSERYGKPTTPGDFETGWIAYLEYMETFISRYIT